MSRIRIYELARELDIPSSKLVAALADLDLNVKNHMSTIDETVANIIRDVILPKGGGPSAGEGALQEPKTDKEIQSPQVISEAAPKPEPIDEGRQKKTGPQEEDKKEINSKPMATKQMIDKPKRKHSSPEAADLETPDVRMPQPRHRVADVSTQERESGRRRRRKKSENSQTQPSAPAKPAKVMIPHEDIVVSDLAKLLKTSANTLIRKLIGLGVMVNINQKIDKDTALLIASELGFEAELAAPPEPVYDNPFDIPPESDAPDELKARPAVVTVMGHVDHGKTSLLDAIRHTKVTSGEAGGITQHIGAYQVKVMDQLITFLDTPGHEAFTAMRARGAKATDIAILVVAADDGVMPQTVEAINHAKAAQIPIIVAVNKIDRPQASPEIVKQQLTEYGLIAEEWGGDTICVNVSAKERIGLDDLMTSILTVAEMAELKANPNKLARGLVIESKIDKGRGPVASVLINEGTLNVGDAILAGVAHGRIRAMHDESGRRIKKAGPSAPVEVVGLSEVPDAGEPFMVFADEKELRNYAETLRIKRRQSGLQEVQRVSLDDLFEQIKQGQTKELRIIIKADVQGSIEALGQSLVKLSTDEVEVKIIHDGVGPVNESDILLATASDAIIVGFNVRPDASVRRLAEEQKVDIRLYRIIYDAIEDVQKAIRGLLAPVFKEVVLGQAEVRQVFRVSRVGVIAGCYVTDGKITRQAQARLIRGGIIVHESRIQSLKRFKDDAREVSSGYECGIGLEGFNDIKEGDTIEAYAIEEIPR